MSSTAKVVIIVSSILLVCIIGFAIVFGVVFSNRDVSPSFSNLFGTGIEINETEQLSLEGATALNIDCVSGDIKVIESDEAYVTLTGNIRTSEDISDFLKVTTEGSTVTIKFDIRQVPFTVFSSSVKMNVYLPKQFVLDTKVDSSSGDVEIDGLDFKTLVIKSVSGGTIVENCSGTVLDMDKSSGDTRAYNVDFKTISVNSISGDVDISNTTADIEVSSSSGDTTLESVSGSVGISSTSGRVSVSVDGDMPEAVTIKSVSGDVKLYLDQNASFNFTAKATSGRIKSDFNITVSGLSQSFTKSVDGVIGEGGNPIYVNTTSGDILLIEK